MHQAAKGKTYVVVGSMGAVGAAVASRLEALGHRVRPVSRRAGVSIDDATALTGACSGVDGAFLLIPFDMQAPDLHTREDEVGAKRAEAVKAAGVRRVVLLSGTTAHLRERSGSARGAAMMERRLDELAIPELVHLRACWFMENFFTMGIVEQAPTGVFRAMFSGDIATPMVPERDVGERAAELLTEEPFCQMRVREVLGARDYTMVEVTHIIGSAIGRPALKYEQISHDDARQHMVRMGLSPSFVEAVIETARLFNRGALWGTEARSVHNTTATTLERFGREAFGMSSTGARGLSALASRIRAPAGWRKPCWRGTGCVWRPMTPSTRGTSRRRSRSCPRGEFGGTSWRAPGLIERMDIRRPETRPVPEPLPVSFRAPGSGA